MATVHVAPQYSRREPTFCRQVCKETLINVGILGLAFFPKAEEGERRSNVVNEEATRDDLD